MPRVERKRLIPAPVSEVWSVISDPHHLPRWWPRTQRVEHVLGQGGRRGTRWTQVLQTREGRGVRADFRCLSAADNDRYVFEQELTGTPFAAIMTEARTEIRLRPSGAGATEVTLAAHQRLRGLSLLGAPMVRRATGRTLSDALTALEHLLPSSAAGSGSASGGGGRGGG